MLAANLPDADLVAGLGGPLNYLHHHRGISHSLAGVLVLSLLLAMSAALLERVRGRPARLRAHLIACLVAMCSHPLLDLLNSYGLRPFLPWSARWYYGDAVFIIDPWIWLMLAIGIGLSTTRARVLQLLLAGIGIPGLLLLAAGLRAGLLSAFAATTWLVALALALVCALRWKGAPMPRAAALSLLAVGLYCALLGAASRTALWMAGRAPITDAPAPAARLAAMPRPLAPFHWTIASSHDGLTALRVLDLLSPATAGAPLTRPTNLDHPAARAAAGTCAGRALLHFQRFPIATIEERDDGYAVTFEDLRFGDRRGPSFAAGRITLDRDLALRAAPACPW